MNRAHITFSRAAVALLVSLGATTPTLAAVCKNVYFSFKNDTGDTIEVLRVRYHDDDSGNPNAWRTENVEDETCFNGNTCNTDGDNLGSVTRPRRNHELDDIQAEHRHVVNGEWGTPHWSSSNTPADPECRNDRTYGTFSIAN